MVVAGWLLHPPSGRTTTCDELTRILHSSGSGEFLSLRPPWLGHIKLSREAPILKKKLPFDHRQTQAVLVVYTMI